MKAVGIYVIIKATRGETRTSKSGLDMPTELVDRFLGGEILSCSKEVGEKEFGLKAGQSILYDKNAGHGFTTTEGDRCKLITARDVAVIL